jgi:hypothetical protein
MDYFELRLNQMTKAEEMIEVSDVAAALIE